MNVANRPQFPLTCPSCGKTRTVKYQTYWASMRRDVPGRCRPCGRDAFFAPTRERTEKRCGACGATKPLDAFYLSSGGSDGRASRCIECSRRIAREYAREHSEAAVQRAMRWAAENPERRKKNALAYARRFRRAHPERANIRKGRVDFAGLILEFGMVCHICESPIDPPDLHFDHVIPLSRGGAHSIDNIRPAHAGCNLRKGTKLMAEL